MERTNILLRTARLAVYNRQMIPATVSARLESLGHNVAELEERWIKQRDHEA